MSLNESILTRGIYNCWENWLVSQRFRNHKKMHPLKVDHSNLLKLCLLTLFGCIFISLFMTIRFLILLFRRLVEDLSIFVLLPLLKELILLPLKLIFIRLLLVNRFKISGKAGWSDLRLLFRLRLWPLLIR